MSADRRFLLLFAAALAALLAIAAVGRDASPTAPAAVAGVSQAPDDTLLARSGSRAPLPQTFLQPVLATSVAQRFPGVAPLPSAPSLLADAQIVSYYGNPYSADMGILGADDPEAIADLLEARAALYDRLNGPMGVIPALHLVYAVAQPHAADDGLFLQYVGEEDVRRYIELARERNMLIFLDLQIGRSSVDDELAKVLPLLADPWVHLALDPEFAVPAGEVPGSAIGSLRAADINTAQATLQRLVDAEGLPPKLLMVHQFLDSMVVDGEAIADFPGVDLIIDMDGFGPAEVKRVKYEDFATRSYASHAAIKLFLLHDPDLMSEEEVLRLVPTPDIVIYQ